MSFSDVDKANWGGCVLPLKVRTEKAIAEYKDEDKCHMMIPYFNLNDQIPPDHPFFSSVVSFRHRLVVCDLNENGWTNRLEWCLNKVYERKVAFSQCYGDDWMRVGDRLLDHKGHWHPFSGTPDMIVMEFGSIPDTAPIVVAKEGILESKEGILESKEGMLECKEGHSGGEGQLYAAMLYTAATEILRHLLKGEDVSEQTVTVKGLLINRCHDCTTCQLEVQPFGAGYPNWSCTTINGGALNAQRLLWILNKLWELPSKG